MKELIAISNEWFKVSNLPREHLGHNERHLERVCEALSVVLPNCKDWFSKNKSKRLVEALIDG